MPPYLDIYCKECSAYHRVYISLDTKDYFKEWVCPYCGTINKTKP